MHFSKLICLSIALATLASAPCRAFDPVSAIAVVQGAAGVVSAISDTASEVAGAADAVGELYSEVDSDATVSPEASRTLSKLRELESLASEIGYTKEEIQTLLEQDNAQTTSLTAMVQKLTRAIRLGKKVARLISRLEKKAQMAQIETAATQREQLAMQYRLLNEQIDARLSEKKEKLQEILDKKKSIALLGREVAGRGGRVFGRTGIYTFPKIDRVLDKSVQFAKRMSPVFAGLVLLAFLLRVLFYQIGFHGREKYGDVVRDSLVCLLLLAAFPQIIHAAIGISQSLAEQVSFGKSQSLQLPSAKPSFSITDLPTSFALTMVWAGSWFRYAAFILADFLFNFGLAFLVLLFPLVIFISQMLNFSIAWPAFLASFLILSLWPVFWNATGMLALELWAMNSQNLSDNFKTLCFSALQLISPAICLALFRGQSIAQAVQGGTHSVLRTASSVLSVGVGAVNAAQGKPGGAPLARAIGATSAFTARQVSSRGWAAAQAAYAPSGSQSGPLNRMRAASRAFVFHPGKKSKKKQIQGNRRK
jgi:hypothetical protein